MAAWRSAWGWCSCSIGGASIGLGFLFEAQTQAGK
jgi:hypothetical protein